MVVRGVLRRAEGCRMTSVSAFLPPRYVQQLLLAAAARDWRAIDEITDELVAQYPELVRPRAADGGFRSKAKVEPQVDLA